MPSPRRGIWEEQHLPQSEGRGNSLKGTECWELPKSLLPKSARGFPVFLEVLVFGLRLWGQVQGLSPGLPPLQGSHLTAGWETQAEGCG